MSYQPDHRTFREAIKGITLGLERGDYQDEYNHADACKCVVGLALESLVGQPLSAGDSRLAMAQINSPALDKLFEGLAPFDSRDQVEGARRARQYLAETADLETV